MQTELAECDRDLVESRLWPKIYCRGAISIRGLIGMTTAVRFTAGQFDKMIAGGVFEEPCESHVELVFGELRDMPPPSLLHEDLVDFLTEWSTDTLPRKRAKLRV